MIKKTIFIIVIFILFFLGAYWYYSSRVSRPVDIGEGRLFGIASGQGVGELADRLEREGIIDSAWLFKLYVKENGQDKALQAGEYDLPPTASIKELARIFATGQSLSRERTIKIIEGWNLGDIGEYLAEQGLAGEGEIKALAYVKNFNYPFLNNLGANTSLEGYIFPDTYRIYNDAKPVEIIEKTLDNFQSKINPELLADIKAGDFDLHQILTLASIIEKEVTSYEDKQAVSGILRRRLDIGMRLEVDATINYLTGKNNPSSSGADLEIDSPYNTYKYYGLPPGPICNPGLDSIKAAVYPRDSEYLFYLNRQDTGQTIFSQTYEEHLRNKRQYLD